jgi:7-cyano-7-deazaguanine synthase in queuosine biosynthesis
MVRILKQENNVYCNLFVSFRYKYKDENKIKFLRNLRTHQDIDLIIAHTHTFRQTFGGKKTREKDVLVNQVGAMESI